MCIRNFISEVICCVQSLLLQTLISLVSVVQINFSKYSKVALRLCCNPIFIGKIMNLYLLNANREQTGKKFFSSPLSLYKQRLNMGFMNVIVSPLEEWKWRAKTLAYHWRWTHVVLFVKIHRMYRTVSEPWCPELRVIIMCQGSISCNKYSTWVWDVESGGGHVGLEGKWELYNFYPVLPWT